MVKFAECRSTWKRTFVKQQKSLNTYLMMDGTILQTTASTSTVNIYNWTWTAQWTFTIGHGSDCYPVCLTATIWGSCYGCAQATPPHIFYNWMFGSEPSTLWNHHIIFKILFGKLTSALVLYFPCFWQLACTCSWKFQSSTGIVDLQFILFLIFSNVKIKNQCLFPLFWHNLHCCIIATKLWRLLENQIKSKVQTN